MALLGLVQEKRRGCTLGSTAEQHVTDFDRVIDQPADLKSNTDAVPSPCYTFRSEAREASGSETARVHYAARRHGSLAARGARAAASHAGGRLSPQPIARSLCTSRAGLSPN